MKMRARQKTTISFKARLVIGTSCCLLIAIGIFVSLNVSNVHETMAATSGDYRNLSSGNWEDASIWETFQGKDWQPATTAPGITTKNILIKRSTNITVNSEITVYDLVIEAQGTLKLNFPHLHVNKQSLNGRIIVNGTLDAGTTIIDGTGDFKLSDNSEIVVGSQNGLNKTNSGNVQVTGSRYFSSFAHYIYKSSVLQNAGTGLPYSISKLTIDNTSGVKLESNLYISSQLSLKNGTLNTDIDTLFLGTGKSTNALVTRDGGGISGNFKRWLNKNTMKDALFPLTEGINYNAVYMSVNTDDYSGGAFTFSYHADKVNNNAHAAENNTRIIIIGETGYYKVTASEGFEGGIYKLVSSIAVSQHENKSYWVLNAINDDTERKEEPIAEVNAEAISNIVIAPNPFHDKFTAKFNLVKESEVEFNLINASGQLVFKDKINGQENDNAYNYFDQRNMPAGNYILRIISGEKIETRKLIKQ